MTYSTIVADPPWPYEGAGMRGYKQDGSIDAGVGSVERYDAMSIEELCTLRPPADMNAHLYLWTTNSFMVEAHRIAEAWGFKVKTICTWGKVQIDGKPSRKSGYYFRGATEHCLFAVRGSLPLQIAEAQATLWLWPRLPHSVKPDAFFDLVEVCSPGPYLEMFARRNRLGWDTWGNQSLGHVDLSSTTDAVADSEDVLAQGIEESWGAGSGGEQQ